MMDINESNYLTCHRRKELNAQPYYHSNLRSKAEVKRFMSKAEPGEFLLRNSFTETGSYTFSLMHTTGVKHVKLNCHDGSSYSLKDHQSFRSIEQLILYYSTHAIPNSDNLPDVLLSTPILRRKKDPIQAQGGDDYINPIPSTSSTDEKAPPHHYDSVRDVDVSVTADVLRGLQLMDRNHRELCDCGLRMDESELPRGWSVHLSRDPQETTRGSSSSSSSSSSRACCFMSPDGDLTWDLPLHVCLDLTSDQQELIRRLMIMHDARDVRWAQREDAGRGGGEGVGGEGGGEEGGGDGEGRRPSQDATMNNSVSDDASGVGRGGGEEGEVNIVRSFPTSTRCTFPSMGNSYAFVLEDNAVESTQL